LLYANTFLGGILAIACLQPSPAVQADGIGDFVGYAKTFLNAYNGYVGSTTVTPSYALIQWRRDISGYYHSGYYETHYMCNRSVGTGTYIFSTRNMLANGTFSASSDPFLINVFDRLNYNCNQDWYAPDGALILDNASVIANFTVMVWTSSLVKTGIYPPSAPYSGWLMSDGVRIPDTCNPVNPVTITFKTPVSLYDSGYSRVQVGWVNYSYSWPMTCWAGNYEDY
jgi:hypothetical protein